MLCKTCGQEGDFYPHSQSRCKSCLKQAIARAQAIRRQNERKKYGGKLVVDHMVSERLRLEMNSSHNAALVLAQQAYQAKRVLFHEEEQRTQLRLCKNCGPLRLEKFYVNKRGRQCRECIIERTMELKAIRKLDAEVTPIKTYQPKLIFVDFPKSNSLVEVTNLLFTSPRKTSHWKAA